MLKKTLSETPFQQSTGYKGLKNPKFLYLIATAFEKNAKLEVVFKAIHI